MFSGALANGLKYEAQLAVLNDGGTIQAGDGSIEFKQCNGLTVLAVAAPITCRTMAGATAAKTRMG